MHMSPLAQGISWLRTVCIQLPDTTKHISKELLEESERIGSAGEWVFSQEKMLHSIKVLSEP